MYSKKILLTGVAGFIGFHLAVKLIEKGHVVVGLDNINDYYDVNLKLDRLKNLGIDRQEAKLYNQYCTSSRFQNLKFIKLNLEDRKNLPKVFKNNKFDEVINMAAQAGVRYSLEHPEAFIDSNLVGFLNLLECCRQNGISTLLYASSSSVYGKNFKVPFSTDDQVDHPISLYAATKKSNELMAHTYSYLYGIKTIGLRFFTVYGPWGRPDMAMFLFTDSIINGKPIKVFNDGELERDFTYIDDIVVGVETILQKQNKFPIYSVLNIGRSVPVKLTDFIEEIEMQLKTPAIKKFLPLQPGDVIQTWADISPLKSVINFEPKVNIKEGISHYLSWYKAYYI